MRMRPLLLVAALAAVVAGTAGDASACYPTAQSYPAPGATLPIEGATIEIVVRGADAPFAIMDQGPVLWSRGDIVPLQIAGDYWSSVKLRALRPLRPGVAYRYAITMDRHGHELARPWVPIAEAWWVAARAPTPRPAPESHFALRLLAFGLMPFFAGYLGTSVLIRRARRRRIAGLG
jgi:hypothetical protein